MTERSLPLVVVVGGAPGTGKTTLASPLATALELPLLSKDLIKENLMDSFGVTDIATSHKIGVAGWKLLYQVADWLLDAGMGFVIEGNFEVARAGEPLRRIAHRSRAVQINCQCPDSLSQERYERRATAVDRHPGHMDAARIQRGARPTADFGPLDLGIPMLVVDTTASCPHRSRTSLRFVRGQGTSVRSGRHA
jgi:predicted kinase